MKWSASSLIYITSIINLHNSLKFDYRPGVTTGIIYYESETAPWLFNNYLCGVVLLFYPDGGHAPACVSSESFRNRDFVCFASVKIFYLCFHPANWSPVGQLLNNTTMDFRWSSRESGVFRFSRFVSEKWLFNYIPLGRFLYFFCCTGYATSCKLLQLI